MNPTRIARWLGPAVMLAIALPDAAGAIPAFARRYGASCALCHSGPPRLNAFGEQFAANGFQFQRGGRSPDTVGTGDPLLHLMTSLPLAVRVDAFAQMESRPQPGIPGTDLLTPYVIKLLSGGQIARNVSYYMYFLLTERGEVGGLEDAFLQFSDVLTPKLDLVAGQFQASDLIFKRELRLTFEDYQPYRMRVGASGADLTYERGLLATYSAWAGGDVAVELLNGHGLSAGNDYLHYSTEGAKHVLGRVSQSLGPVRIGVLGYYGADRGAGERNRIVMLGADATLELPIPGGAELNLQYLHRRDDNPFLEAGGPAVSTDAAMTELTWMPAGPTGRVFITGLVNWLESDHQALSLRLGEQNDPVPYLKRYRTTALNTSYLFRRNLRLLAEGGYNLDTRRTRLTIGAVAAF